MSSPTEGGDARAADMRARLATLGLHADVTIDGGLAVIEPPAGDVSAWAEPETRAAVVREARACGFTHVAVALVPPTDADVRRTQSVR